jgi:plastocyanin
MDRSSPPIRRAAALILALSAIGLAGCGSGGDPATARSGTIAVTIEDFAYAPAELTVARGTRVVFHDRDRSSHTATARDPAAFDTGTIEAGATAAVELEDPGTYAYYCAFHPFMTGTVTVE